MPKVLVVYHSQSGNTEKMANALAQGAQEAGVSVVVKRGLEAGPEDLLACDALAIGSPDYFSYMAGGMKDFFDRCYYPVQGKVTGKPCAVFGSAGGPPSKVIGTLLAMVKAFKFSLVGEPVGAGGTPGEEILQECRSLGRQLAAASGG
jgi:multimeric flavodoxin WrbA